MTVYICRGPRMKEIHRESVGVRWCFACRTRTDFTYIVRAPIEPSYYGSSPRRRTDHLHRVRPTRGLDPPTPRPRMGTPASTSHLRDRTSVDRRRNHPPSLQGDNMPSYLTVKHPDGEDRYDQDGDEFNITEGLLEVSRTYRVEITEESIAHLTGVQANIYRRRLGEYETNRAPIAYYAPGHWHQVHVIREG